MSDSEEDYMSDKILMECQDPAIDIRPGLLFNSTEKRKHEIFKKKEESRIKRQKPLRIQEKEVREQGLSTAITAENKGFKLLEKMGFKPGEALGKSQSGLKEPINIVIRQGTSGVGRESHEIEVHQRRREMKLSKIREHESKFKLSHKQKTLRVILRRDFLKAQRICEELDFRNNIPDPLEDMYWTKDTIKKRKKESKDHIIEDEDEDSDDEEFESYITEDNLCALINYLRSRHLYCMYCVITGSNKEDLAENCPGPYRLDHDSEFD